MSNVILTEYISNSEQFSKNAEAAKIADAATYNAITAAAYAMMADETNFPKAAIIANEAIENAKKARMNAKIMHGVFSDELLENMDIDITFVVSEDYIGDSDGCDTGTNTGTNTNSNTNSNSDIEQ